MSPGDAASMNPTSLRGRVLKFTLIGCLAVVGLMAFQVFRPFLLDFTVAGSVALLLAPVQRRLTRLLRGRASWAAGLIALLTLVMVLVPMVGSVVLLARQALSFYDGMRPYLQPEALRTLWRDSLPTRLPWVSDWLGHDDAAFTQFASLALSRSLGVANNVAQAMLGGLVAVVSDLMVFTLLLFFLLRDGGRLRQEISRISPLSEAQEQEIFDRLEKTVKGVVQAMVLVPVLQGVVALPGFALCGVPSPLLWSVMVVLAAFVPVLGSPLAWVPAVVYLYLHGSTLQWVGMLLYGLVIISGIDNVVKPLLLREAASLHPMLGFLAILGGLLSFGPLGLLVGPVILSLVLSAIRIYRMDILGGRTSTGAFPPVT